MNRLSSIDKKILESNPELVPLPKIETQDFKEYAKRFTMNSELFYKKAMSELELKNSPKKEEEE